MSILGCSKCQHGVQWQTCCSGRECGCGGFPVQATNCPVCNADNREITDPQTIKDLDFVEWVENASWARTRSHEPVFKGISSQPIESDDIAW